MKRYSYCLTINNPTIEDYMICSRYEEAMLSEDQNHPDKIFRHIIFGMEGIEEKRTPHIQMCFYLKKPMTFRELKTIFPRAHIEPVYAFYGLAVDYCKKEGFYVEYGSIDDALQHAAEKHEAQKKLHELRQSKLKGRRLFSFSLLQKGEGVQYYPRYSPILTSNEKNCPTNKSKKTYESCYKTISLCPIQYMAFIGIKTAETN